jgi:hypothetical protein
LEELVGDFNQFVTFMMEKDEKEKGEKEKGEDGEDTVKKTRRSPAKKKAEE